VLAERDYHRLREVGIQAVREGIRWHLIETEPGRYDFASVLPILTAAQRQEIQVIWDLFHFGWPDHLDIFDPSWVDALGGLASAFARMLKTEMPGPTFIAPVNEISFISWGGGEEAHLNPFALKRGAELKRQLVRGFIRAADALRAEIPDVRIVSPEPVIHIVGDPKRPADVKEAAEYRSAMFESWDMLAGRAQPELGGNESYLDVIGLNYYDRNQWWNHGRTIWRHQPQYRPFREILLEVWDRYRRPMFVAETGTEDRDRPFWFAYVCDEVRGAIRAGARIEGICLYPILNHPGWNDDRHCRNGLWDYPRENGDREIYQPLAEELARQQKIERELYERSTTLTGSNASESRSEPARSDLSLAPPMELRISTPTASDEPVRPEGEGLFL
jgi:hypothetical protein